MDSRDDDVLVRLAQKGAITAFAELTERHSPMVYRVSLRMLGNVWDAEDLTQDCMLAAWRGLATFRAEAQYSTWLYRIVTRLALNHLTRSRVCVALADDDQRAPVAVSPAELIEQTLTVDAVTAAVLALPAAQRAVVVLHHLEGLSYKETAAATGSTVSAVSSHLFRARHSLTRALAAHAPRAA